MKKQLIYITILSLIVSSCHETKISNEVKTNDKTSKEIHFFSTDSIKVYGDLYEVDKTATTLLIFHQGGSNSRAEYRSIIPKLLDQGFNIMAIDQRSGGQYFYGGYNRTVAEIPLNEYHYCDAYPDMEAALNFVVNSGFTGKKVVWGSSYSGTLALKLTNQNKDLIDGVLAFSPASGPAMKACQPMEDIALLTKPFLLLKPASEMQSERSQDQIKLAKEKGHFTYIADNGVHGSSMLDDSRVEGNANKTWDVVNSFLAQFK